VKKHHDRLLLVAFACLETSPQLPPWLRNEVQEKVRSILPPRTEAHVHALSLVGEYALPLLAQTPPKNARQAVKAIETASAIGGPEAVPIIGRALAFDTEQVFLAAVKVWRENPGEDLAPVFLPLAEARRPHYYVPVYPDQFPLQARYMPNNPSIAIEGRTGDRVDGLAAHLPHLAHVELRNRGEHTWHGIDLAPLAELPRLTTVTIFREASAESITPLAASPIESLDLSNPARTVDLHRVQGFSLLRRLHLRRSLPSVPWSALVPEAGLDEFCLHEIRLPDLRYLADVPDSVRKLRLWTCPLNLEGLESQAGSLTALDLRQGGETEHDVSLDRLASLESLTALSINEPSWRSEANIRAITRLHHLRRLSLTLPGKAPRAVPSWVRDMPYLTDLYVWHVRGRLDLAPLAGVENLTVHIKRWTTAVNAELLGPGSSVFRVARNAPMGW
jgi:hypothetical protein